MTTRREGWSFDSENSLFSRNKITRSSGRNSRSSSIDLQTCGICTKLLHERSSWAWNNQKIISNNDLNVVSVLNCEHVYHAECLECITSEVDKFDPPCPVCTYDQKRVVKMSEKALKAELDLKARKRSWRCVVTSDMNSGIVFYNHMKSGVEVRSPDLNSSSSMKSSREKTFLKRHSHLVCNLGSRSLRVIFHEERVHSGQDLARTNCMDSKLDTAIISCNWIFCPGIKS